MDLPVPAYLMALAVGTFVLNQLTTERGLRRGIDDWQGTFELEDMGKMVNAAEKLYGPTAGAGMIFNICLPVSR